MSLELGGVRAATESR